jgi:hypothetical protein
VTNPGIDLGNGKRLAAEDVLEGHYRRVTARRTPIVQRTPQQVQVQVADNLVAAIAVLAPELAPLTAIAEDVSSAVPLVQPAPKFRAELQEALERTHRQHAAQRVLGTRRAVSAPRRMPTPLWWLIPLFVLSVFALWWKRHSLQQLASKP